MTAINVQGFSLISRKAMFLLMLFVMTLLVFAQSCGAFVAPAFLPADSSRSRSSSGRILILASESSNVDPYEAAWRHVRKPLLRIGKEGATKKHGNSLRDLLGNHQTVKVKVNMKQFESLEGAFERLVELAIESGASSDLELIQARAYDSILLIGRPGTKMSIEQGNFPPRPTDEEVEDEE